MSIKSEAICSSISKVRVAVRVRPLSSSEQSRGGKEIVKLNFSNRTVTLGANESKRCFTYDTVFDQKISQHDLYEDISSSLLNSFLDGYNATVSMLFLVQRKFYLME